MKNYFWIGLFSCSLLTAAETLLDQKSSLASTDGPDQKSSLSSTNASYDGNALLLTGHVELDHGLGKMTAENASLQRQDAEKDFPFSFIELKEDVHLFLKNDAELSCQNAVLDFTALKGVLLPKETDYVVYTDLLKKKKNEPSLPLKFQGKRIDLDFLKQTDKDLKTEYTVDTVFADSGVIVHYRDGFELTAESALYLKETPERNGLLTTYPKDEQSRCQLIHCQDLVEADQIDLNLSTSKIALLRPKGILFTQDGKTEKPGKMHFQADSLDWDALKNTLDLEKNIHIEEETLGTLIAQEKLQIQHTQDKAKMNVRSLRTEGPAILHYHDAAKTLHKLASQGPIFIDREQLIARIESPKESDKVPTEQQLYYEENEIAVYADQAHLEYALVDNAIQPICLTLKGNVRLFSHDPAKPLKCGLADRLTYSLTTRTLILSADPGHSVLFSDAVQGMHLAAPEVHITQDAETKQQNVKGVGKVHFAFTPEEQSKIQQFFPQLKKVL